MSTHKIQTSQNMNECIDAIDSIEQVCKNRFTSSVCKNMRNYFLNYCYNKFENKETCSSVRTLGANTLNFSIKSPPAPL